MLTSIWSRRGGAVTPSAARAHVASGRLGSSRATWARPEILFPGVVMFAFGWTYPHFLETRSFLPYLYSAPTGLVPCPTLSVVVGLGLMLGGLGSRGWSLVIGVVGIFYGLFGRCGSGYSWTGYSQPDRFFSHMQQ